MQNSGSSDILIVIIIGTLAVLMLISFIVLFVLTHQKKVLEQKNILSARESEFQKNLVNAALLAAEEERMRLAANLHDDAGILIVAGKHKIHLAERAISDVAAKKALSESLGLLDNASEVVRNITRELAPGAISTNGLQNALQELCMKLSSENLPVEFVSTANDVNFEIQKSVNLYRMVAEILNNLMKHAAPKQISVMAEREQQFFRINILHNGTGLDNAQMKKLTENSSGLGLKNIVARAQLTASKIDYTPDPQFSRICIQTTL